MTNQHESSIDNRVRHRNAGIAVVTIIGTILFTSASRQLGIPIGIATGIFAAAVAKFTWWLNVSRQ